MMVLPQFVIDFMDVFRKNNFQIYLVGGAVRHLLMNEPVKNWDFTTDAPPEKILSLFEKSFYNNEFGTVSVLIKQDKQTFVFEVTTMRKESGYSDKRRPDNLEWTHKIEEDLTRRDFTINAIAYNRKMIVDPHGGQKDLKQKLLRAVGDADKRFGEDALRLMRAIRIATTLGFIIEENTRQSIIKNASLIKHVSWERIRDELFKILSSPHPAEGILFLRNTGILAYILPELDVCFSIPQKSPQRHHIYDVGTHSVMSLKACSSTDVITRFAVLLHDIGKATTFKKNLETGLITFFNHEIVGSKLVKKIADRLNLSNEQKNKLITLVRHHQFSVNEFQTDKAIRRFIKNVGKNYIDDMFALRTADRIGSGATPTSWRYELFKKRVVEVQKQPFSLKDLNINGNDVMKTLGLQPGPHIGQILNLLFKKVVDKKIQNNKETLLKELEKIEPV